MIRARFETKSEDPRPVNWPIKHPYWITGYGDDCTIIVAYADNPEEIRKNWPEAENVDFEPCDEYFFSDRFPEPEWFKKQTQEQNKEPK